MRVVKLYAVVLCFIMISPAIPVKLSIELHKDNANLETEKNLSVMDTQHADSISPLVGKRKLIMFKNFSARDQALKSIDKGNILYVFKYLPAFIAEKEVDASQFKGVTKLVPSAQTFYRLQSDDPWANASTLGLERELNTLKETKDWISIEPLWKKGLFGQNQSIAIIDSGVNRTLQFRDIYNISRDRGEYYSIGSLNRGEESTYDYSGHGTHVAGIAVSNGLYFIGGKYRLYKSHGMAPEANFKSVRVLDAQGVGDNLDVLAGIDFAISLNVSVLSMSFGSNDYNGTSDLFAQLMKKIAERDILAVVAAGNNGGFGGSTIGNPGVLDTVLSVGALETPSSVWEFSSRGPSIPPSFLNKPDVLAPGVEVVSVNASDGSPLKLTGTSMAVPHVSGGSLLLRQAFPQATAVEIKNAIIASANDLGVPVEIQGRGLVNFTKAYEILEAKFNNSEKEILERASVNPVAIHDGQEFDQNGQKVRTESNTFFRASIINETRAFNLTVYADKNMTVLPRVATHLGNVNIGVPQTVELHEGTNIVEINITVTSKAVEYVKATIYFLEAQSLELMKYMNVSYFALSRFPRAKILIDASKDADTLGDYYLNDRPEGKFSTLTTLLRDKGYIVEYTNQSLTASILDPYQMLIIPDPDIPYSGDEILAIRDFVDNKGGGLLLLGSGGYYSSETNFMGEFAIDALNALLRLDKGFGEVHVRFDKPAEGYSAVQVPVLGQTSRVQDLVPQLASIPFYGPYLSVTGDGPEVLATYRDHPIMVRENIGKGRIIVSSSVLPFVYEALERDKFGDSSINRETAYNSIDWLAESRNIKVDLIVDETPVGTEKSFEFRLYDQIPISFKPSSAPDGTSPQFSSTITAYLVHLDAPNFIAQVNFTQQDGTYQGVVELPFYGDYDLIIPMVAKNYQTSITLEFFAFLDNFEEQKFHDTIAISFLWLMFFTWLLWLKNEGGRELKRKLKSLE